jgi:hypothetical protein
MIAKLPFSRLLNGPTEFFLDGTDNNTILIANRNDLQRQMHCHIQQSRDIPLLVVFPFTKYIYSAMNVANNVASHGTAQVESIGVSTPNYGAHQVSL